MQIERSTHQPARLSAAMATVSLLIVAFSYVVNAMDRLVFPQFVRTISHEFHFALAQGGLLATIYALGFGITGIPAGYLIDRWSRKGVAVVGIAIYSLMTIATVASIGFWDMALYRTVSGLGEAMQQTAIFTMFGAYFFRSRALALGTLNAAFGLGAFLGPVVGIQIYLASGHSWRGPQVAFGVLGLAFMVLVMVAIPKLFSEAREPAQASMTQAHDQTHVPAHFLNRNVLLASLANAVVGLASFGYLGLYPTFLKTQLHFTTSEAGFAASMFGIGAFMGIPAGWIGDRLPQRFVVAGSVVGSMVALFLMFEVATLPWQQNLLSFAQGTFGSGFLFVNIYSLTQRSTRREFAGRSSGLASTAHYFPAGFAGLIFGYFAHHLGWGPAALGQLVLLPIVGIIAMLFVRDDQLYNPKFAPLPAKA